MGFQPEPTMGFRHPEDFPGEHNIEFPVADTCVHLLRLPCSATMSYDVFKQRMLAAVGVEIFTRA